MRMSLLGAVTVVALAAATPLAIADSDMQAGLDALAKLGPRPIATLTPNQARRQPTPAQAVTALQALRKAGVKVERKVYGGAAHEFFGMAAVVRDAKDAQRWAGERLRAGLATVARAPTPGAARRQ